MDFDNLYKAIVKAWQNLMDAWMFKTVVSLGVGMITSVHGSALAAFATLVFIDLLTRWIALSYVHLKDSGKSDDELDLYNCLIDIPAAIKTGYINSDMMKHRFVGKVIVYILLTVIAVNVDKLLNLSGETPVILKVVWIYLATTEGLSVLENLRDSGIEQAKGLLDFFRDRLAVFLGRLKQK